VEEEVPLLPQEVNSLAIYSTSHKTSTSVKLAVVCCSTNAVVNTSKMNLSENTTENQAELSALLLALQFGKENFYKV
jgi:ribonuclease HI